MPCSVGNNHHVAARLCQYKAAGKVGCFRSVRQADRYIAVAVWAYGIGICNAVCRSAFLGNGKGWRIQVDGIRF